MQKYQIRLSNRFVQHEEYIYDYIFNFLENPHAAEKFSDKVTETIKSLQFFPEKFMIIENKYFPNDSLHRLPILRYSIFYKIDQNKKIVFITDIMFNGCDWKK